MQRKSGASVKTAQRLAEAVGVPMGELFAGGDVMAGVGTVSSRRRYTPRAFEPDTYMHVSRLLVVRTAWSGCSGGCG